MSSVPPELAAIRAEIDRIDTELVRLIAEREGLVRRAAPLKRDTDAVRAPDRVREVLDRAGRLAVEAGATPELVQRVYHVMITAFVELELGEHRRS